MLLIWIAPIVLLNVAAQLLFKVGSGRGVLSGYVVLGLVAYGLSTLGYLGVLSRVPVSIAYPLVIGLTVVMTTGAGVWVLGESVVQGQWLGVGLVLSGIGAIALAK